VNEGRVRIFDGDGVNRGVRAEGPARRSSVTSVFCPEGDLLLVVDDVHITIPPETLAYWSAVAAAHREAAAKIAHAKSLRDSNSPVSTAR